MIHASTCDSGANPSISIRMESAIEVLIEPMSSSGTRDPSKRRPSIVTIDSTICMMITSSRRSITGSTGSPPTTAEAEPGVAPGAAGIAGAGKPVALEVVGVAKGATVVVVVVSVTFDTSVVGDAASAVVVVTLDSCACDKVVTVLNPPSTVVGGAIVVDESPRRAAAGAVVVVVEVVVVVGTVATIDFGEPVSVV